MAVPLHLQHIGVHKKLFLASVRKLGKLSPESWNICHYHRSSLPWPQYRAMQTLKHEASVIYRNVFSANCSKNCDKLKNVFYRRKHKLPFEVDSNVTADTVVFTYRNDRYFKMLSAFGIIQFFFWLNISGFVYTSFDKIDSKDVESALPGNTLLGKVASFQAKHRVGIAGTCMIVANMVLFFTWMYPQRTITQLKLLKGGKSLAISTYTHFARTRTLDIPLEHFSCLQSRTGKGTQVSAKIKNRWFYFQMDKREGKFQNIDLFDFVVGLKREIKKK